jgi:dimethylhistidine N-methyltransferase
MTAQSAPLATAPLERDAIFLKHVLDGLARDQKALSPKWLYDAEGSRLFDAITRLPEYYVTRTEMAVLKERGDEIASFIGPEALLVEYGAGSGEKAAEIIRRLHSPKGYVCIEIEATAAKAAAKRVAAARPGLAVDGRVGDFTALHADPDLPPGRRVGYFPGSTIGNFDPEPATALLAGMREHLGENARLVLGVDQVKPVDVLIPAYDDAAGVTAAFNLNLLVRMNRELGADFVRRRFRHEARWNEHASRIEMHLVSLVAQTVTIAGSDFAFAAGESIHTENSYKYDRARLSTLVERAGWRIAESWGVANDWFRIVGLIAAQ